MNYCVITTIILNYIFIYIIGAKKVQLEKQLVYSLVTEKRDALAINNIDVISWEYENFMKSYAKRKRSVWMEKINDNVTVINKK
jgi:hypothetical protein